MLNFGYIAKGPGLTRRPVTRAIMELARQSSSPNDAIVDIAYVLPGRLGRQESAFKVRRERGGAVVFVAVPEQLVRSIDPMADLLFLAKDAIERAGEAHADVDVAAAKAELDRIARRLVGEPLALLRPGIAVSDGPTEVHDAAEVVVAIDYRLTDDFDFDAGAALEAQLAAELSRQGLASVDGNEVGEGVYTIVIHGRDAESIREAVTSAVARLEVAQPTGFRALIG